MVAVAVVAAVAFAAGWLGRSRRAARLDRSRTAKSLRAHLGAEAWLLRALAVIRGERLGGLLAIAGPEVIAEEIGELP